MIRRVLFCKRLDIQEENILNTENTLIALAYAKENDNPLEVFGN